MFENKKKLKEIERAKQQLEYQKAEILREKAELQFIKEQLADTSPKVDISNTYVFTEYGIRHFVNLSQEPIRGENKLGVIINGYRSTLIDIFAGGIVYEKSSKDPIFREETVYDKSDTLYDIKSHCVTCYPICEVVPALLAYPDKQVPKYVLQQVFYQINNVNINAPVLKKTK